MLSLRVLSRSALMLAMVAACSSTGSPTTAPTATAAAAASPAGGSAAPSGPTATAPGTAPASVPVVAPEDVDPWARNASEYEGMNGQRFAFPCPPNGSAGTVWGTDTYTDDSSVCTAGVQTGVITLASGGYVVIEIRPGQDNYTGSDRNGVSSSDYGSWNGSYVVIAPGQ